MLRLLEHYVSVQGEGPRVGVPTQFVRFAGCNLKCPAWPCDTPHAIDPKLYRKEQKLVSVEDLSMAIIQMAAEQGADNVCLTGGEPYLQSDADLLELCGRLYDTFALDVEMFTNGTLPFHPDLLDYVGHVCDWKLVGSGEGGINDTRVNNMKMMYGSDKPGLHAIKFTVANMVDFDEAQDIVDGYRLDGGIMGKDQPWITIGRVWNGALSDADVVRELLERGLGWRFNMQMHQHIWPANERMR